MHACACACEDHHHHEQQQNSNSNAIVMTTNGSNNIRATEVAPKAEKWLSLPKKKKNPPLGQNFGICEISKQEKLIEYNPPKEESKYLQMIGTKNCQ